MNDFLYWFYFFFLEAQSQNRLLTCEYTVHRLIGILERSRFKSGDHVDVFDANY